MSSLFRFNQHGKGKRAWGIEEDLLLQSLVSKYSTANWSIISENLPDRTGKQCRERWINHLNPGVNKGGWTAEVRVLR